MGFWSKPKPSLELEAIWGRIRELADGLHEVQRDLRSIQTEWNGQFGKYQALYARLAKQAKMAEKRAEDALQDTNGDGAGVGVPPLLPVGTSELSRRFRR